jgi:hypothetical protein
MTRKAIRIQLTDLLYISVVSETKLILKCHILHEPYGKVILIVGAARNPYYYPMVN